MAAVGTVGPAAAGLLPLPLNFLNLSPSTPPTTNTKLTAEKDSRQSLAVRRYAVVHRGGDHWV
jgi:hypothetical protein